jgi:hypothetical protein
MIVFDENDGVHYFSWENEREVFEYLNVLALEMICLCVVLMCIFLRVYHYNGTDVNISKIIESKLLYLLMWS